jgi:hypothetical protein
MRRSVALVVQEDGGKEPVVVVYTIAFYGHALAFDQLPEIGFGFPAIGSAREFGAFGGFCSVYPNHSDAKFRLVRKGKLKSSSRLAMALRKR